jgi:hypothetical protein
MASFDALIQLMGDDAGWSCLQMEVFVGEGVCWVEVAFEAQVDVLEAL